MYLLAAHVAFCWASAAAALHPELLTGYFYQPRTLALVHAVALGWISCTILGSLYLVAPIAMRARLPGRRRDDVACALVLIGAAGLVSHFWIDRYVGMVWSAGTLVAGLALAAIGIVPSMARGNVGLAPRLGIVLAWGNLLAAATLGTLAGLQKIGVLTLPGTPLAPVWAHAHLAGIGWATMMVLGVGYRLLPMLLPAALPGGPWPSISVVALQVGVTGLAACLLWRPAAALPFAWVCAAAIAIFVLGMAGRVRQLKPPPVGLARPDPSIGLVAMALLALLSAAALGTALLVAEPSADSLRLAAMYGAVALVGFLSVLIAGVGMRLFPLAAWMRAYGAAGFVEPALGPHALLSRRLQWLTTACWAAGAPLLAVGIGASQPQTVRLAAILLLGAAATGACNHIGAMRRLGGVTSPAAPRTPP